MNWLLGTQGRFSVNVPHGFSSFGGILGTGGWITYDCPPLISASVEVLGTDRRFPVIVLHRSEKAGRTNLMKRTAVPNCSGYSENQGEQT